ncbi:MAG TPA: recombinase family protein [Symbiobacteriaceae bacterium]|nr:recombinase family protein [Symbiobacteriaceae bacterium]
MFGTGRQIDPAKAAVYIRWSTEEQGQGTTLEVQQEACEYYCRSQGWFFRPELVFVDEGYSGATLDRPALSRLRQAVADRLVDCVIVYKLDRLSRNLLDCVTLVRKEWGEVCALFSTKENFDTHSPVGQMVFNILVSFAEFERNVIRDRTLSGKMKRAEQGRNAGQLYPYGYVKGPDGNWALDGRDAAAKCFTGRAAIVRRIFDEYLAGRSARAIAAGLRADGIPAPRGGSWRNNSVAAVLDNPAYAGTYSYGKRRGGRRAAQPTLTVANALPPIITEREWANVRRLRTERAAAPPRSLGSGYLLSGLARCAKCGGSMAGAGKATDKKRRYYTCTNRVFLKNCDCAYIDADSLEAAVIAEVKAVIQLRDTRRLVEPMAAELRQRTVQYTHVASEAAEALAALGRKRRRLDREFLAGYLDGKSFSRLAQALNAEAADARRRVERAQADLRSARDATAEPERLMDLARQVDPWAELSQEELKQVLRDAISSVTVYQQKAAVRSRRANPNPIDVVWRPKLDRYHLAEP